MSSVSSGRNRSRSGKVKFLRPLFVITPYVSNRLSQKKYRKIISLGRPNCLSRYKIT